MKNSQSQFWSDFEPGQPDSFASGKIRDKNLSL